MQTSTRFWVSLNGFNVGSYADGADAVIAYDPFVNAWLDDQDLTLAQAAVSVATYIATPHQTR